MDDDHSSMSWFRRNWKTVFWLAFLLILAAVFRVAFNYGPATEGGDYRYAGNDDYYHHRVVESIQTEGQHLERDDLLNYPVGATNPRPPLYNWHVAMEGRVLEAFGMPALEASMYALEWGSALWGILTVIPIWLTGRFLYNNRAGLWAGFLMASSPAHIQRSGFGLGDHDAFVIFFLCLGFYFLVRALRGTRDDTRVGRWTSLSSIGEGFGLYADRHREGLAYAFLAGISFVAIALSWEGYPYAAAIYAVYYVFQLVTNQLRRRDSTGDLLVMLIVLGLLTVLPLPYYWGTTVTLGKTVVAMCYLLAGLVVLSLALIPTRDLPSILVLPSFALVMLVGWAFVTFVVPDIGAQLFSANGYFNQSKVYSTIAEAQRTEIGVFVFSVGFMVFFLALVGFVYAIVRFFKRRERDQLFVVVWALVSIYMAFAATRFIFNAAPVFAILAGWMVDRIVTWMNVRERVRDFQSLRHESLGKAVRSTLGARQVAGALFLGLFLLVPNVWFSFDAGLPSESRQDYRKNHPGNDFLTNQTGAFGQGFLDDDWLHVYKWLATQDTGQRPEDRPAHMAWWDYGFWEVDIGRHPTVADNFQNGILPSGRFLAAESEKEGIEWLMVRCIEGDWREDRRIGDAVMAAVRSRSPEAAGKMPSTVLATDYIPMQQALAGATSDSTEAAELYMEISDATGCYIAYFLTDLRMLPVDDPNTPDIESGSIFYAPVYLANKNPDDYIQTVYVSDQSDEYRVVGYETGPNGDSRQVIPPNVVGPDGKSYVVGGGQIIRTLDGTRIDYTHRQGQGERLQSVKLDYKDAFYQTMYYRGYVGGTGAKPDSGAAFPLEFYCNFPNAGRDLVHWRVVRGGPEEAAGTLEECNQMLRPASDPDHLAARAAPAAPTVRLLKFYLGAELKGRVEFQGNGVADVSVEVYDDLNVRHQTVTTAADGTYRALLPFSLPGGETKVKYTRSGLEMATRSFPVSEDQAMRRAAFTESGDLALQPATVDVFSFVDVNRNGGYDEGTDRPAGGAEVRFGDRTMTVGDDGHAVFTDIVPGGDTLSGTLRGYTANNATGSAPSGGRGNVTLPFTVTPVEVRGTVKHENGTAAVDFSISNQPVNNATEHTSPGPVVTTDANGTATILLYPGEPQGTYRLFVNQTLPEGETIYAYTGEDEVVIRVNEDAPTFEITLSRREQPA